MSKKRTRLKWPLRTRLNWEKTKGQENNYWGWRPGHIFIGAMPLKFDSIKSDQAPTREKPETKAKTKRRMVREAKQFSSFVEWEEDGYEWE